MVKSLIPEYHENIPHDLKDGILYVSKEFETAIHLCACGCGNVTVTPFSKGGWTLTDNNGIVTLNPSVGNFGFHCKSHYFIRDNQIVWC